MREEMVSRMMNLVCILKEMRVPEHFIDECIRITGPLVGISVQIFHCVSFFPTLRLIKRIKIIAHPLKLLSSTHGDTMFKELRREGQQNPSPLAGSARLQHAGVPFSFDWIVLGRISRALSRERNRNQAEL